MMNPQPDHTNQGMPGIADANISEQRALSFGEKRVGITFNPSRDPKVDETKKKHAFLIDYMKEISDAVQNGEVKRLCAESMTQLETACMFAVKALTYPY